MFIDANRERKLNTEMKAGGFACIYDLGDEQKTTCTRLGIATGVAPCLDCKIIDGHRNPHRYSLCIAAAAGWSTRANQVIDKERQTETSIERQA